MSVPVRAKPSSQPFDSPRGMALLRDPLLNKGIAFTEAERDALGLRGFLPAHVLSMEEQVARVLVNLRSLPNDLHEIRTNVLTHVRSPTSSTWCRKGTRRN